MFTVAIALHAASGFVALAAGMVALRSGRLARAHLWSAIVMAAS